MFRGSDLIGMPVLVGDSATRIGQVGDVLLSADGARICGLVLDGGWLSPRRVLDFQAVRAVGESHVLADEVYLTDQDGTRCRGDLQGLPVLHPSGEEAGILDDFHFDPDTGQVTMLQLSRGFVDDLLSGKEVIPLTGSVVAGDGAILLDGPEDQSEVP